MMTLTAVLIVVAPALVVIYDLVAKRYGGREATITNTIQRWTVAFPELPAFAAAIFVWLWLHLFVNGLIARVHYHLPPVPAEGSQERK